jgi:acetyl-CoA synthetase
MAEAEIKWFVDAKVNITKNCIDRHLAKKGDKTAIIFEPNDPSEEAIHISYTELHQKFPKWQTSRDQGYKKDRVCIYLPMIPRISYCNFGMCQNWSHPLVVLLGFSSLG